jgi:ribulose-phosphate 3-epimerase
VKRVFQDESSGKTPPIAVERSRIRISPSLMCADLCNLEREVRRLEGLGVDMLHIDLMDGRFTPNMPLGLELVRRLRSRTELAFDVHLMVSDNSLFLDLLSDLAVQQIAVHVESADHLDRLLARIRETGARAGAALNPSTPFSALEYVLERLDFVLLMTVNPGFAGQAMVPSAIRKIADCRAFLEERGAELPIEVDGNVSFANIPAMVEAGADILVSGTSSLFHREGSLRENMTRLRRAASKGAQRRLAPSRRVKVG